MPLHILTVHGDPVPKNAVVTSTVLKNTLMETQLCFESKILCKKLPRNMTVGKVKLLCCKLFSVSQTSSEVDLVYIDSETSEELILNDFKELSYYPIEPTGKIVLELK